jgi:hypothetical protein
MAPVYQRKLIAKELELGFLYIPAHARGRFPTGNQPLNIFLGHSSEPTSLTYNSAHHRLFGLTSWYRSVGARPKDAVGVQELEAGAFRLTFEGASDQTEYTSEEAREILDLSGLPSSVKGDIVEDRVKEQILLFGQGLLSVYKPVSDREGIDLIVVKNGVFHPIFLQVKGRFNLQKNGAFLCDIRMKTFKPHHSFFVVAAYFDPATLELHDPLLLVPTEFVAREGTKITVKGEIRRRVMTSMSPGTKSKWAPYLCTKQALADRLLAKFQEMETYVR